MTTVIKMNEITFLCVKGSGGGVRFHRRVIPPTERDLSNFASFVFHLSWRDFLPFQILTERMFPFVWQLLGGHMTPPPSQKKLRERRSFKGDLVLFQSHANCIQTTLCTNVWHRLPPHTRLYGSKGHRGDNERQRRNITTLRIIFLVVSCGGAAISGENTIP